jgi:hypothetical protein
MFVSKLEENGSMIKANPQVDVTRLLGGVFMKFTLDAAFSPAGELYLLNNGDNTYGTCGGQCGSIDKIIYTGGQCPQSVAVHSRSQKVSFARVGNEIQSTSTTPLNIRMHNLAGKRVLSATLLPGKYLDLAQALSGKESVSKAGTVFILTLSNEGVVQTEKFVFTKG